jgi:hypothetical protein
MLPRKGFIFLTASLASLNLDLPLEVATTTNHVIAVLSTTSTPLSLYKVSIICSMLLIGILMLLVPFLTILSFLLFCCSLAPLHHITVFIIA